MTAETEIIKPPVTSLGVLGWLKKNLFSTWYNALLTIFSAWLLVVFLRALITWAVKTARWEVITANLRLFIVGQYPPEQVWRVHVCVLLVALLLGISWAVWQGLIRQIAIAVAAGFALLALVPFSTSVRLWLGAYAVLIGGSWLLLQWLISRQPAIRRVLSRVALVGWLLSFPAVTILLSGFENSSLLPKVSTSLWGGLLLTILLAVVGIVASFPLGVLLALGRRSELPVVRMISIGFIELVRGVPLVTVLFMAQIMLPLFLPEGLRIDRVVRAMAGMTLFAAAYMAENVRGGLQSVPEGQVEAAKALGLSGPLTLLLIVLPQALRAVIPAIVGQFISLFKDTTLVAIIGLIDILGVGRAVLANPKFLGLQREVYVFLAVVFFVFSYAMSYASYRIEQALGVGER